MIGEDCVMTTSVPLTGVVPPASAAMDSGSTPRRDVSDEQTNIDKLVAAFVRIRSVDRLEDALISRCWLAADMGVSSTELDRLLKLMRWQGLIELPNEHLVTVNDAAAMREIAEAGAESPRLAPTPGTGGHVAA